MLWNSGPLSLRFENNQTDLFTCKGGKDCDNDVYYQNLPDNLSSRFPMRGTRDVIPGKSNMLYLPEATVVYLFTKECESATTSCDYFQDWINTGYYGPFLANDKKAKIYKRIISAGLHTIDISEAILLFTKSGKNALLL